MKFVNTLLITGTIAIACASVIFLIGSTKGTGAEVDVLPETFIMPVKFNTPTGGLLQLSNIDFLMRHDSGYFQFGSGAFDPKTGEMELRFGPAILKPQAKDSLCNMDMKVADAQLARDQLITNFLDK